MSSIALELQKEVLNSSAPTSDQVRKALVLAIKLDIEEFRNWIKLELNR